MISISKLQDIGMLGPEGTLLDYPGLTEKQQCVVVKTVLNILNTGASEADRVRINMDQYLQKTQSAGRTLYSGFPDFIVKDLMSKYGPKLIDFLLLDED